MAKARTIVVAKGKWGTVECAVRHSGDCPASDFLLKDCANIREKTKDKPEATAQSRFMVLFQEMANVGPLAISKKRFKKEAGKLFAFSHEVRNLQIRFPCFSDGCKWILTHGFIKPGAQSGLGDWPAAETRRAETIMEEYFGQDDKGGGGKGKGKGGRGGKSGGASPRNRR